MKFSYTPSTTWWDGTTHPKHFHMLRICILKCCHVVQLWEHEGRPCGATPIKFCSLHRLVYLKDLLSYGLKESEWGSHRYSFRLGLWGGEAGIMFLTHSKDCFFWLVSESSVQDFTWKPHPYIVFLLHNANWMICWIQGCKDGVSCVLLYALPCLHSVIPMTSFWHCHPTFLHIFGICAGCYRCSCVCFV